MTLFPNGKLVLLALSCCLLIFLSQDNVGGSPTGLAERQTAGRLVVYDSSSKRLWKRPQWNSSQVGLFTIIIGGSYTVADKACTVAYTTLTPAAGLACAASAMVTMGLAIYGLVSGVVRGGSKRDNDLSQTFWRGNETHSLAQIMHHQAPTDQWVEIGRMIDYEQPNMWGQHYRNTKTGISVLRLHHDADGYLIKLQKRQDNEQTNDDGGGDMSDWAYGDEDTGNGSGMSGTNQEIAHVLVEATNSYAQGDGVISNRNCANFVHTDGKERSEVGMVTFGPNDNQPGESGADFKTCESAD